LAYLPEILDRVRDFLDLLDRALKPAKSFERKQNDLQNDLRLGVAVHGIGAYHAGRALIVVSEAHLGSSIYPHARTIFEALVRMRWMRADPLRARRYLQSEPFGRYALATERVQSSWRFPIVVNDCRNAIDADSSLLGLITPKVLKKAERRGPPNYYALIARALRLPNMRLMALAVGMDDEDYFIDYAFPSQQPHSTAVHTKSFATGWNKDQTAQISTAETNELLVPTAARSLPHLGNIIYEVLQQFPDGAIEYAAEICVPKVDAIVSKLAADTRYARKPG
jgi:hypothetical protein